MERYSYGCCNSRVTFDLRAKAKKTLAIRVLIAALSLSSLGNGFGQNPWWVLAIFLAQVAW